MECEYIPYALPNPQQITGMKAPAIIGFLLLLIPTSSPGQISEFNPSETLWYDQPAEEWTEALPIGNGRLGAMVYGNPQQEIIQFNEETLWTGQPHDYAQEGAHLYLDSLRHLLWSGRQAEAHQLGNAHFMSQPLRQLSYQPFGNILLDFSTDGIPSDYQRELRLSDAICAVHHTAGAAKFRREMFVSFPDQALIIRLESDQAGAINLKVGLDSPHDDYEVSVIRDIILLKGKANNYTKSREGDQTIYPESRLNFAARLKVLQTDGTLAGTEESIEIQKASKVTLALVAATNFVNYHDISGDPVKRCENYLTNLEGKTFQEIKQAHLKDYQELYGRVQIDLGNSDISKRPTNERLGTFYQDQDPSLVSLLFQYGRYLLISSSRPGTQPANLQGIWNDQLAPAWDSKYTININAEMNYWPAEITNLSELAEPIIKLTQELSETGKSTAKAHYNLNGWVAHHNTDLWRGAAPINNANHGLWPTGGAWLCQHLWWHYQFSGDINYLENKAYPILREASRFFVHYLIADKNRSEWLISGPSNSPETGGMVMGPTMDHQIIRNLFSNTIEAAELLGVDHSFVDSLRKTIVKIAPNQIGQHGQLQEWIEDKDDPENKHRHVSHLWGLHPGNEIHPLTTPELAEACKVTLAHRGDGGTGWSRAWKINFWARLLDGDHAFLLLKNLMVPAGTEGVNYSGHAGGLYANLFDAHPPFQIDGNFGATSGIVEMLLHSHLRNDVGYYYQDILPALPTNLSTGEISGIKGRDGFEISIRWENGDLQEVGVTSLLGKYLMLRYDGKIIETATKAGSSYSYLKSDFK